jgi:hypothetical protein
MGDVGLYDDSEDALVEALEGRSVAGIAGGGSSKVIR